VATLEYGVVIVTHGGEELEDGAEDTGGGRETHRCRGKMSGVGLRRTERERGTKNPRRGVRESRGNVERGRVGKSGCCFELVVEGWIDGLHPGLYTRAQQCSCHERSLTMA
tara:strand:+ start:1037 stop:1369 length:333 start_codon:yes stop_codon:yes gene_type:complete